MGKDGGRVVCSKIVFWNSYKGMKGMGVGRGEGSEGGKGGGGGRVVCS